MNAARFISFWTGFCSLSFEISWVRLYGYANQSTPEAFAYVLAIYLLGIAAGAQFGKRICRISDQGAIENASIVTLAVASLIAAISPWAYLYSQQYAIDGLIAPLSVLLTAAALSVLFPITHHLGTPQECRSNSVGKGTHFSRVYIMNVLGAALGPLVTGYLLMEYLTITQVFAVLSVIVALLAIISWVLFGKVLSMSRVTLGIAFASLFVVLAFTQNAWKDPDELAISFAVVGDRKVVKTHENRHGIISIAEEPASTAQPFVDYSVYGGNVYDGKVNVDLERNTNGLERPLALHVLQPDAKRVLVLGLSIGSWLAVVEGFPGVEKIDVVEINPGYLELAENYASQRRAIKDPRVSIFIDDARRWLQFNPEKKYDLILMNTTWHWRANSSMLLSQNMMKLISRHLSSTGVVTFNATGSVDAFFTASTVFKQVRRYQNFIYGANWDPFTRAEGSEAWEALKLVTIDGNPGFAEGSMNMQKYSKIPFVQLSEDLRKLTRPPEVITDDNMLVEYKYGRKGS